MRPEGLQSKAIFLDRDGTIVSDTGYLSDPAAMRFLPGVREALRAAQDAGYLLITISNQSGIGRGLITEAQYRAVQEAMLDGLRAYGVTISGSYFCPHAPSAGCDCRKPKPGMILQAARELGVDLRRSVVVGDKVSDIAGGKAVGCKTILINRKRGEEDAALAQPDWEVRDWEQIRTLEWWDR